MAKFYLGLFCALLGFAFVTARGIGFDQGGGLGTDYYAYPKYQYGYAVNDPHSGDFKSAGEVRDGDAVRGHYQLVEPDGSVRTVHYVADVGGFRANVQRTPNKVHGVRHEGYLG